MNKERWNGIRKRLGPVGLSLAAAAVTAVAFAGISLAQNDDGDGRGDKGDRTFEEHVGPPGGGPGAMFFDRLSDEDRQKMEDFRQCMEDNGAPAPPHIERSEDPQSEDPPRPPKPPSSEEIEKAKQAYEACKDKLPEDLQERGFPPLGHPPCGPPPGAPGGSGRQEQGGDQGQSEEQGYAVPAPAPSGAAS